MNHGLRQNPSPPDSPPSTGEVQASEPVEPCDLCGEARVRRELERSRGTYVARAWARSCRPPVARKVEAERGSSAAQPRCHRREPSVANMLVVDGVDEAKAILAAPDIAIA